MPGNASGGMDGIALKPLTVSFSEPGFVAKLNSENQFGPWFTLSNREQQQLGSPMGPQNPQSLNRYSYVLNNPMRYADPSGHCIDILSCTLEGAAAGTVIEPGGGTIIGGIGGFIVGAIITVTIAGGVAYVATHPSDTADTTRVQAQPAETVLNIDPGTKVKDILKGKKGSIKNAPLGPGAPSWEEVEGMSWGDIEKRAKANISGYKTLKKLLSDKRFDK